MSSRRAACAHPSLLLSLLHPEGDAARRPAPGQLDPPEWSSLWEQARRHKLDGLVARRVLEGGEAAWPEPVLETAATVRADALDHARRAGETVAASRAALAARSIRHLVVKGTVLAAVAYGDPASRRSYDVDIVVARRDVEAAESALTELGYRFVAATRLFEALDVPKPSSVAAADRFARTFADRHHCQYEFRPPPDADLLHVDLHWRLFPKSFVAGDDDELWTRADRVCVADTQIETLDLETTAVHLAIQAMRQRPSTFRLLPVVDLAWLIHRHRARLDPGVLERRARRWRALGHWQRALETAEGLLPGVVARRFGPPARSLRRRLFAAPGPADLVIEASPGAIAELRWRLGVGDARRVAAGKVGERLSALAYRRTARLPGSPSVGRTRGSRTDEGGRGSRRGSS